MAAHLQHARAQGPKLGGRAGIADQRAQRAAHGGGLHKVGPQRQRPQQRLHCLRAGEA